MAEWPKLTSPVEWDSTGEALVYDAAGNGLQGLTGGTRKEDRRVEFILPPSWFQKGSVVLYIEASTNGMTGNNCGIDPSVVSSVIVIGCGLSTTPS